MQFENNQELANYVNEQVERIGKSGYGRGIFAKLKYCLNMLPHPRFLVASQKGEQLDAQLLARYREENSSDRLTGFDLLRCVDRLTPRALEIAAANSS